MLDSFFNSLCFYSAPPTVFHAHHIHEVYERFYDDFNTANIYLIAKASRLWFMPQSTSIFRGVGYVDLAIQNGYRNNIHTLELPLPDNAIRISVALYPHKSIRIFFSDGSFEDKSALDILSCLNEETIPSFEVLYVGKAIGRKNNRNVLDRLKKDFHKKLTKISLDTIYNDPGKEVFILSLSYAHVKKYLSSNPQCDKPIIGDEIKANIQNHLNLSIPRDLQISLIEEALINYFKTTEYNTLLTKSFDSLSSKAISEIQKLGIHSLCVELNNHEIPLKLFSKCVTSKRIHLFPFITLKDGHSNPFLVSDFDNYRKRNFDYLLQYS